MRNVNFVSLVCGWAVRKFVQSQRTTQSTYAHNQPRIVNSFLNTFLCTINARVTHHVLHTFFMQYQSVSRGLFTQSTGLITTTTLINK